MLQSVPPLEEEQADWLVPILNDLAAAIDKLVANMEEGQE